MSFFTNRVMKKNIYTTTLGFSFGIFTCNFMNYINDFQNENMNSISVHPRNSVDAGVFLSNVQKNVSEEDGGFFTPSPQVEESIIVEDFQDI